MNCRIIFISLLILSIVNLISSGFHVGFPNSNSFIRLVGDGSTHTLLNSESAEQSNSYIKSDDASLNDLSSASDSSKEVSSGSLNYLSGLTPVSPLAHSLEISIPEPYKDRDDVVISPVQNFTSILKGPWKLEVGNLQKIDSKEGTLYFDIAMSEKKTENNVNYSFIRGDLNIRNGNYITDDLYYFIVIGVYNGSTGFLYAISPSVLEQTMTSITARTVVDLQQEFPFVDIDMLTYFQNTLKVLKTKIKESFEKVIQYFSLSDFKVVYHGVFEGLQLEFKDKPTYKEKILYSDRGADKFVKAKDLYLMSGYLATSDKPSKISFHTETQDSSRFYLKSGYYTILASSAGFLGIVFLLYQMKISHTQSMRSRISVTTIAALGMLDSYCFLLHFTLSIYIPGSYGYISLISFFNFVIFSIFEMKFMLRVWKSSRQLSSDQLRRQVSALYTKYYGALFLGIIIVYQFNFLFKAVLFVLFSFFVPQIILNFRRNAPKALHPIYVIGTGATRLIIPLYFYGCPENFFLTEVNYPFCLLLTSWMFLQSSILIFQYYFGSRSFVPQSLLPQKYNYKRPIPDSVIESGELTCVICYENVDSETCLVTPCDHVYHEECLLRWMEVKLECPSCRQPIPFY